MWTMKRWSDAKLNREFALGQKAITFLDNDAPEIEQWLREIKQELRRRVEAGR